MDADAWITKDGERIPWADLTDRHLWNIVRMLTRAVRRARRTATQPDAEITAAVVAAITKHVSTRDGRPWIDADFDRLPAVVTRWRNAARKQVADLAPKLARAFAEVEARGLFPTREDLCIAWDRVCGGTGGPDLSEDPAKRPWCLVELWVGFRGESTVSAEYAARIESDITRESVSTVALP